VSRDDANFGAGVVRLVPRRPVHWKPRRSQHCFFSILERFSCDYAG